MTRRGRRRAFTLIELLVVIAVITILAALMFPILARARARARTATCASNMGQLARAWTMYAQDYEETLPLSTLQLWWRGPLIYWPELIEPYVRAGVQENGQGDTATDQVRSIFMCPDYFTVAPAQDEDGNPSKGPALGSQPLLSYSPNVWLVSSWSMMGQPWAGEMADACKLAAVDEPSRMVLLAENHDCCDSYGGGGPSNYTRGARRHSDGANYAMVDGHVTWFRGGSPQYGMTGDREWPGCPVCQSRYDPQGQPHRCAAYFRPRGG